MALTVRYFDSAGAGTQSGTSWANRAPLYVGGSLNAIITAYNFTTDNLLCWIGPGNYTSTQSIVSGIFTIAAPGNSGNGCYFHACDASGNPWQPPQWSAAAIPTWKDALPYIDHTANSAWSNLNGMHFYGIRVLRSNASFGANTGPLHNFGMAAWCCAECSTSNTAAYCWSVGSQMLRNCVAHCSGTSYSAGFNVTSSTSLVNCKAIGNASASSGTRAGFTFGSNSVVEFTDCCSSANDIGINNSTTTSGRALIEGCTVKAGTQGIYTAAAATTNVNAGVAKSFVVADSNGISRNLIEPRGVLNNRVRATTALTLATGTVEINNQTAAGTDADEFVDAANHDLRIKNTSSYWGQGLGAGDQPAAASGAALTGLRNRGIAI